MTKTKRKYRSMNKMTKRGSSQPPLPNMGTLKKMTRDDLHDLAYASPMTFTTLQTQEEFGGARSNHEIPSCGICEGGTYRLPCRGCGIRICDVCRAGGATCECHNPWFRLG